MSRAPDGEPTDGRVARSYRSRRAIVDAMRALHAEGDLRPTAPRVAERAGVSVRTVWQQFADMETLLVEADRRDNEILRSLVQRIDPDLPLTGRIAMFTGQRARILEQMTPTWRAARLHEPFSAELARNKAWTLAKAKTELETVFTPELGKLARQEAPAAARRAARDQHLVILGVAADRAPARPRAGRGPLPRHLHRAARRGRVRVTAHRVPAGGCAVPLDNVNGRVYGHRTAGPMVTANHRHRRDY